MGGAKRRTMQGRVRTSSVRPSAPRVGDGLPVPVDIVGFVVGRRNVAVEAISVKLNSVVAQGAVVEVVYDVRQLGEVLRRGTFPQVIPCDAFKSKKLILVQKVEAVCRVPQSGVLNRQEHGTSRCEDCKGSSPDQHTFRRHHFHLRTSAINLRVPAGHEVALDGVVRLSLSSKPSLVHCFQELFSDRKARFVSDDRINATTWAKCGHAGPVNFIYPFFNFRRRIYRDAIEAPALLTRLDLSTMAGRVIVCSSCVCRLHFHWRTFRRRRGTPSPPAGGSQSLSFICSSSTNAKARRPQPGKERQPP